MDIDSLGTERLRALIQQGYVKDISDLYFLPEKREELLGLEISDDQYVKSSNGYLYVSLKKALYSITYQITLKEIDEFINLHDSEILHEKIIEFIKYVKETGKKTSQNVSTLKKLKLLLDNNQLDLIEDFVPIAYILYILVGNEENLEDFKIATKNKNSVHEILISDALELIKGHSPQVNKLKGTVNKPTFSQSIIWFRYQEYWRKHGYFISQTFQKYRKY
jgi:DNA ligase (NAD+)